MNRAATSLARQVRYSEHDGFYVSTIELLGIAVPFYWSRGRCFETMAFSRRGDSLEQRRTTTEAEALRTHDDVVREQSIARGS